MTDVCAHFYHVCNDETPKRCVTINFLSAMGPINSHQTGLMNNYVDFIKRSKTLEQHINCLFVLKFDSMKYLSSKNTKMKFNQNHFALVHVSGWFSNNFYVWLDFYFKSVVKLTLIAIKFKHEAIVKSIAQWLSVRLQFKNGLMISPFHIQAAICNYACNNVRVKGMQVSVFIYLVTFIILLFSFIHNNTTNQSRQWKLKTLLYLDKVLTIYRWICNKLKENKKKTTRQTDTFTTTSNLGDVEGTDIQTDTPCSHYLCN